MTQMEQLATEIQSRKSIRGTVAEAERQAFDEHLADLENRLQYLAALEAELQRTEFELELSGRASANFELPTL